MLCIHRAFTASSATNLRSFACIFLTVPLAFFFISRYNKGYKRGYGGIGRHARFRFWWETVGVQVPLGASCYPHQAEPGRNPRPRFGLFFCLRLMSKRVCKWISSAPKEFVSLLPLFLSLKITGHKNMGCGFSFAHIKHF